MDTFFAVMIVRLNIIGNGRKKLTRKETERFWKRFKRNVKQGSSLFPELMLSAYYQKEFSLIKKGML